MVQNIKTELEDCDESEVKCYDNEEETITTDHSKVPRPASELVTEIDKFSSEVKLFWVIVE